MLASVGNRQITKADFEREVQWRQQNRRVLPEKSALLEEMISRELRLQKARAAGLEDDPDVRRRYEAMLVGRLDDLELKPKLEAIQVSPEEVQAVYEQEREKNTRPAKSKLALIVLKIERKTSEAKLKEMEQRIVEARTRALTLPPGTTGFGAVAVDYSEDQASRYRGGDVGWFDEGREEYRWPKEVVAAGMALQKPGEISEVIRTSDGFYLVTKLDSRPAVVTPLAQLQNSIQRRLEADKRQQLSLAFNQQLRTASPVQTYPQALAEIQYPTGTLAKSEETVPPTLQGTTISNNGKLPAN